MSAELFAHIIADLYGSTDPRTDQKLMKTVGTFITLNALNDGHPFSNNELLPNCTVGQMAEIIVSEGHELDKQHPLFGTMTWAAEWWNRLYLDDAIYAPRRADDIIIPRVEFEAMPASGELVKVAGFHGVYQIATEQYVVILKLPRLGEEARKATRTARMVGGYSTGV